MVDVLFVERCIDSSEVARFVAFSVVFNGLWFTAVFGSKVRVSSVLGRLKLARDWRSFIGEHLIASKYVFFVGSL